MQKKTQQGPGMTCQTPRCFLKKTNVPNITWEDIKRRPYQVETLTKLVASEPMRTNEVKLFIYTLTDFYFYACCLSDYIQTALYETLH